jgi:ornithine cyclodeaminase/alanine dehydrogenase-like protein (mu-crystallin family)
LLAALRTAGVPAYAAHSRARDTSYQLWVGSSAHARAEETLIRVLGHRARG